MRKHLGDGTIILPAETSRLLTGHDVTADPTVTHEQRGAPRVPVHFHPHVVHTPRVGDDAAPIVVKLENLSRSGVRLLMPQNFGEGETFFLPLQREPDAPVWVRCRALHVERAGGDRHSVAAGFHRLASAIGRGELRGTARRGTYLAQNDGLSELLEAARRR